MTTILSIASLLPGAADGPRRAAVLRFPQSYTSLLGDDLVSHAFHAL